MTAWDSFCSMRSSRIRSPKYRTSEVKSLQAQKAEITDEISKEVKNLGILKKQSQEASSSLSKLLIASAGYILGIEDGPYNGLSEKQYRSMCEEKHDEAEADALINEYERSESALEDESFNDYRSQCIYEEWQDAGNPGYIESFEIGLMCESLSKEERERLLQVAKLMFPDAVYLTKD